MLDLRYPRDLAMVGAIFGGASFVWAGWAQENPPDQWGWRLVLALLALAGCTLGARSSSLARRYWDTPTALGSTTAMTVYIVVFWVEVILAAGLAYLAVRTEHSDLVAPLILGVVGIHFFALAPVFAQPVLYLAGILLTAVAAVVALTPTSNIGRSFWCGLFGALVLLSIGAWAAVKANATFHSA